MGATVTTNKAVSAFKADNGKIVYVLFEETYEKNCHPHTPYWSAVQVGETQDVLRWIFRSAASCEGGMLQGRSGCIRPESYVQDWMKALSRPTHLEMNEVHLKTGHGYDASVPESAMAEVLNKLHRAGLSHLASDLQAGKVISLNLREQADTFVSIYGKGALSPWRILPGYLARYYEQSVPELGYQPAISKNPILAETGLKGVVKLGEYLFVQETGAQQWRSIGAAYAFVQSFIASFWEHAWQHPDSFNQSMTALRQELKSLPEVSPKWKVSVDLRYRLHAPWVLSRLDSAGRDVGIEESAIGPEGFSMTAPAADDRSLWILAHLPPHNVSWTPPDDTPAKLTEQQSACQNTEQFALFA